MVCIYSRYKTLLYLDMAKKVGSPEAVLAPPMMPQKKK